MPVTPITPVSPPVDNSGLPPSDYPSLVNIVRADLVGPSAANRQPKTLERRTVTLATLIFQIIQRINIIDTDYLRRTGDAQQDTVAGMKADLPMGNKKITGLADGTVASNSKEAVNGGQLHAVMSGASSDLASQLALEAAARIAADNALVAADVGHNNRLTSLESSVPTKAPIASPTFTGTVNAPTPDANANSTLLATTAWVRSAIASIVPGMIGAAGKVVMPLDANAVDIVVPNVASTMLLLIAGGGGGVSNNTAPTPGLRGGRGAALFLSIDITPYRGKTLRFGRGFKGGNSTSITGGASGASALGPGGAGGNGDTSSGKGGGGGGGSSFVRNVTDSENLVIAGGGGAAGSAATSNREGGGGGGGGGSSAGGAGGNSDNFNPGSGGAAGPNGGGAGGGGEDDDGSPAPVSGGDGSVTTKPGLVFTQSAPAWAIGGDPAVAPYRYQSGVDGNGDPVYSTAPMTSAVDGFLLAVIL